MKDALASLVAGFDRLFSAGGCPSIAPERLMRASLIQILFSVRSERHPPRRLRPVAKRRKRIKEPLGWAKTISGMAQTVLRGIERARFTLTMVACNLAKLPKLRAV